MEATVKFTNVHDKNSLGCKEYKRDVMLQIDFDPIRFNNYYLTQEQAVQLVNQLQKAIKSNEQ